MKFFASLIIAAVIFAAGVTRVDAAARSGEVVAVGRDEVINEDFFAAGEKVEILGTINGDLYAMGGTVSVDGKVTGDALIMGGNVNVNGEIGQDLRVLGGNLMLGANVGRNASFAVGNVDISKVASVSGRIVDAKNIDSDWKKDEMFKGMWKGVSGVVRVTTMITFLIIALLIVKFLPRYTLRMETAVAKEALKSTGVGLLMLVGLPVVGVILVVTIIGIPVAMLLFLWYLVLLAFGKIPVIIWFGNWAMQKLNAKENKYWGVVLGFVVFELVVVFVPVLGDLVRLAATVVGIGALTLAKIYWWRERK